MAHPEIFDLIHYPSTGSGAAVLRVLRLVRVFRVLTLGTHWQRSCKPRAFFTKLICVGHCLTLPRFAPLVMLCFLKEITEDACLSPV